jgi:F0F1-type ATP synthase membrane subunit c/vacuolar-type H+-ATPase subunit K
VASGKPWDLALAMQTMSVKMWGSGSAVGGIVGATVGAYAGNRESHYIILVNDLFVSDRGNKPTVVDRLFKVRH